MSGGASASFVYDGDGKRVKATFGVSTTVYVGSYYEQTGGVIRKYYYANGQRVAMREGATLYYLLTDHLGSTAITADSNGDKKAELRYKAWGENRYTDGATPTTYRFTGQRLDESTGLMYYGARYYDPALGRFIGADTIVPEPGNPQDLNRYAYVRNNPLKYTDPSGHAVCLDTECTAVLHPITGRLMIGYMPGGLDDKTQIILQYFGNVDDLEAMAQISDLVARYYSDWESFLPEMSRIFLGVETYGPATGICALAAGGCGGIGREPRDCEGNEHYFLDEGFHEDFQDLHNQPYHAWGYVAQTAAPGSAPVYSVGRLIGIFGNWVHEVGQSKIGWDGGWGTSWQDYALSESAMAVGLIVSAEAITPAELGDLMRYAFGPEGPGSSGALQRLEERWGPLRGSPQP